MPCVPRITSAVGDSDRCVRSPRSRPPSNFTTVANPTSGAATALGRKLHYQEPVFLGGLVGAPSTSSTMRTSSGLDAAIATATSTGLRIDEINIPSSDRHYEI